jgi:hypothetical protein
MLTASTVWQASIQRSRDQHRALRVRQTTTRPQEARPWLPALRYPFVSAALGILPEGAVGTGRQCVALDRRLRGVLVGATHTGPAQQWTGIFPHALWLPSLEPLGNLF